MAEADPQIMQEQEGEAETKPLRKKRRLALMLSLPLALAAGGGVFWYAGLGKVSTDNAYVKQDKVSISAEVSGRIVDVFVKQDQKVTSGALLFRIDPEPYQLDIRQADADIARAQANLTALSHDSDLSGADIAAAREDIGFAQATLKRQQSLWERGFTTKADLEVAEHAVALAREQLRSAEARKAEATAKLANGAAVPGVNPEIAAASARKATAQYDLVRTEVRAPFSGIIGESDRLQKGQQIVAGLPVLTLISDGASYVEANFKETDLADMKVGQSAKVSFDAFPDIELKGHVSSIGAGTNSEFSILPAQNASGNWVKVTQRVPVRIALDEKSPRNLIAGLSADVTVYTDNRKH